MPFPDLCINPVRPLHDSFLTLPTSSPFIPQTLCLGTCVTLCSRFSGIYLLPSPELVLHV